MFRQTYVIGITAVLRISVWKNEELDVVVPVRPDGKISFPLLDDLQAEGLEVMELKEELKDFVLNGASALELKREAIRLGMQTLRQSALVKLAEGQTSFGEVFRISADDH